MYLRFTMIVTIGFTLAACASTSGEKASVAGDATKTTEAIETNEKLAKNLQSVAVNTSPEGASCTIQAGDDILGTVESTPGNAIIKRLNFKFGADVTCSKAGFTTAKGRLANNPAENQIGGNIGAIFNAVKLLEGSLAEWNDSVFVKLDPSSFASATQRDEYLNSETALLNDRFTAASQEYLTCKKKKCARKLEELQTAYDADLGKLKDKVAAVPLGQP